MAPAQKGLRTHDRASAAGDDRLVMELELLALDRGAEVDLDRAPRLDLTGHLR